MKISPDQALNVRTKLLAWFDKHKRPLPWRQTKDPYKIWVSEIMLQQTQVQTVIPYYERWMSRFPDVRSLAKAPLTDVLKLWEGLGYYRRARMLHAAAQVIIERGGKLPGDLDGMMALPGIGRYTAGAILSIAFNQPLPLVDGNVARVFARIHRVGTPIDSPAGLTRIWDIAEKFLSKERPGDFNESLMELGATVCMPTAPNCPACPVRPHCAAFASGETALFPKKLKKEKTKQVQAVCVLMRNGKKIAVSQRPEGGLWAGLWELPTFPVLKGEDPESVMEKALRKFGMNVEKVLGRAVYNRAYTIHREKLHVFDCGVTYGNKTPAALTWIGKTDFRRFAFPAIHKKILLDRYEPRET